MKTCIKEVCQHLHIFWTSNQHEFLLTKMLHSNSAHNLFKVCSNTTCIYFQLILHTDPYTSRTFYGKQLLGCQETFRWDLIPGPKNHIHADYLFKICVNADTLLLHRFSTVYEFASRMRIDAMLENCLNCVQFCFNMFLT